MVELTPERNEDLWQIEYVLDLAFGQGRTSLSSYQLRIGIDPIDDLSLAAKDAAGSIVGTIRYWPVAIGETESGTLLLGPVAVHPTRQGEGLGSILIRNSLRSARHKGWSRILLVGDEPYYARFGFRRMSRIAFPAPTNPDRILGLSLVDGAFDGVSGCVRRLRTPVNRIERGGSDCRRMP